MNGSNCSVKFVAYYGYDDENVEEVEINSCDLCHRDEHKRDNFKSATIVALLMGYPEQFLEALLRWSSVS